MIFETKEDFKKYARDLFEKHCIDSKKTPFFPNYDEESETAPCFIGYEQNEVDAIWNVYCSLKTLSDPKLVLQRVAFNHNQFHIWDENYNPEACAKSEEIPNCSIDHRSAKINQTDFVIFGSDFVILINVCPWNFDEDEKIELEDLKNRVSNLRKMQELIAKVSQTSSSTTFFKVFKFVAFPVTDIVPSIFSQLQNAENIGGITKEDILDFEQWLEQTIHNPMALEAKSLLGDFKLVQETLFALWHEESRIPLQNVDFTLQSVSENSVNDFLWTKRVQETFFYLKLFLKDTSLLESFPVDFSLLFEKVNNNFPKNFIFTLFNDTFFSSKTQLKSREDYFELGNHFFSSPILDDSNFAKMFPACPNQVYIDLPKTTDQELVSTKNALNDLKKQQDYESEVRVYRALEQIHSEKIAVLHGLRYSHHQYRMWMFDHNAKECASCKSKILLHSDEGEHDFVVLGADYIAIIEVKNSPENVSNSSSSAKDQLTKLIKLIEGISNKSIQLPHSNERMADEAAASKPERTVSSVSSSNQKSNTEKQTAICEDPLQEGKTSSDDNDNLDQAMKLNNQTIALSEETQENVVTEIVESLSSVIMRASNTDMRQPVNRIEPSSKSSPFVESQVNQSDTFHREIRNSDENCEKTAACQKAVEYQATTKTDLSATNSFKIVRCVAFPRITNPSTSDFSNIENEANLITASDLDCFSSWWDKNIAHMKTGTFVECQGNFEYVKRVLLAIWASNNEVLDASKAGIAHSIVATDKKLRDSNITFIRKKEHLNNPDIKRTTDIDSAKVADKNIFSDILKIKFITKEQDRVFQNQSRKLIITGCTGSGKSLILLARMLHKKLKNPELPMILLVFNKIKMFEYQNIFKKVEIDCTDVSDADFNQYLWRNTVGVIHCSTNPDATKIQQLLQNLDEKVQLYVDDAHASNVDFIQFSPTCITLDFNQSLLSRDQHTNCGPVLNYDIMSLTHNYRSTWNLVSSLTRLSKAIEAKEETQRNFMEYQSQLSHHPSHGHLIHGPQNIITVGHIESFDLGSFFTRLSTLILSKILPFCPLLEEQSFTGRIFVIGGSNDPQFNSIFHLLQPYNFNLINSTSHDIFSTEFTACCIVLFSCSLDTRNLRLLYNAMSRARVYCEIFLMLPGKVDENELEEFLNIFKGMKIRHDELGPKCITHRVISDRVHRLLVTLSYFRPDRFVQLLSLIPILILLLYYLVSGCLTSLC